MRIMPSQQTQHHKNERAQAHRLENALNLINSGILPKCLIQPKINVERNANHEEERSQLPKNGRFISGDFAVETKQERNKVRNKGKASIGQKKGKPPPAFQNITQFERTRYGRPDSLKKQTEVA